MPNFIHIREVGLRDGLQLISTRLDTKTKQNWFKKQIEVGFKEIEITSMVPEKILPQFSDAVSLINFANNFSECVSCVLVPNLKGSELAFKANAKKIIFVVSASEEHNLANVKMTVEQSLQQLKAIMLLKSSINESDKIKVIGSISTSFGCSISGEVSETKVLNIIEKMLEIGVDEISIADTVGYANPRYVSSLIKKVIKLTQSVPIIGHFHDTRGFGLANLVAAVDEGVTKFDSSLRGLGGCPYAPGASGNIATEDCANLLQEMGYNTGINLNKLADLCELLESWFPNERLYGKMTKLNLTNFQR